MALEDGLILAELLATPNNPLKLGDEFTHLRLKRLRHVQTMTDRASKITRLPMGLRNILMRYAGRRSYMDMYTPLRNP
jgi:2-polyprenyl-6-methoxyphenol hydroxylase-like FAD-dependent oxidoreductase